MATTIPQVPNFTGEIAQRTDPTTFAERADPQYAYQAQLSVDLNTTVDAINIVSSEAEAAAADAEQAAATAAASANFVGRWDDATGAATKGSVYYHSGQNWQLLDDIADITASEPSNSNSEWLGLASGKNQVSTSDDSIQLAQTATELQTILNDSASVLKAASLAVGCELEQIILATDTTTVLDDILYIHDADEQVTYVKPYQATGLITSIASGALTTDDANTYPLTSFVGSEEVNAVKAGAVAYQYGDDSFLSSPKDSLAAIIDACNSTRGLVYFPAGRYAIYGDGLDLTQTLCAGIYGDGYDYWETVFQNSGNIKSDAKGTHLYLVGTGNKIHSIDNLGAGYIGEVSQDGIDFSLTNFTMNDSVDENPATPKPFSCGIKYSKNHKILGLRVLPYNDGIDGYNDEASTTLSDDWDMCLWGVSAAMSEIDVQAVGHARVAAHLLTENGGYGEYGNCEQMSIKSYAQGQRGLVIRNTEQIPIASFTSSSVTFPHRSDMTITASSRIQLSGSTTNRYFNIVSASFSGGEVTLELDDLVDGSPHTIRSGYTGTGWAKTNINNSRFEPLQHISGNKSTTFGLETSIAREISGFPMRGITFTNSKAQCTVDDGNSYWGDCQDFRNLLGQYEGGYKIAITLNDSRLTNPSGFTSNLREIDSLTSGSVNEGAFDPRDCFDSMRQFPTQYTDGTAYTQPWRDVRSEYRDFDEITRFRYGGSGEDIILTTGLNFYVKNDSGENVVSFFGGSRNAIFEATVTVKGDVASTSNVRPVTTNVGTIGDTTRGYKAIYLHDQTTGVARKIELDNGVLVIT